jgi:hypothetical protein
MPSPTKYITKPVVVEAMQVSLENLADIAKWCGGYVRGESIRFTKPKQLRKPNADNSHYAIVGDYVIKTNYGFTVMKPAKFELRHMLPKE